MIGSKIYRTATSTNSMAWAREHLHDAPHGSVFLVDQFLHVHGRQNRVWQISSGQLIITLILKPEKLLLETLPTLNMALSLGILEPFLAHGSRLKWPNDFVIQGKKIGGMLIEVAWHEQQPMGIILGFALNINNIFTPDNALFSQATSLSMITGQSHDLSALQETLFKTLNHWYSRWTTGSYQEIFQFWRHQQSLIGTMITTHQKNSAIISGLVKDVLPDGSLVLDVNGEQRAIQHYTIDQITTK